MNNLPLVYNNKYIDLKMNMQLGGKTVSAKKNADEKQLEEKQITAAEVSRDEMFPLQPLSLQNPNMINYMEPSKTTTYTIPQGTILYHGSMVRESFNPYDIKLGNDTLVSYFSPNKEFAQDYIIGCALYPNKSGYIHAFRVKKNIENILIISTYEKQKTWTTKHIEDTFCSRKFRIQLNGIGFFFPKKQMQNENTVDFHSEFALCNPGQYLEYVHTEKCESTRKLSNPYNFAATNLIYG